MGRHRDKLMNRWSDGEMDGWMNRRMDRGTDKWKAR